MFDAIYILLAVGFFCAGALVVRFASGCEGGRMAIELILGGAVATALLVYLFFALMHPGRF